MIRIRDNRSGEIYSSLKECAIVYKVTPSRITEALFRRPSQKYAHLEVLDDYVPKSEIKKMGLIEMDRRTKKEKKIVLPNFTKKQWLRFYDLLPERTKKTIDGYVIYFEANKMYKAHKFYQEQWQEFIELIDENKKLYKEVGRIYER